MPLRVVTPPALEPVSIDEAKAHLRIEHTLDDTYITALIQAAREYVEQVCWRGLVTQTWELVLQSFPAAYELELPGGNLQSVTSVQYVDGAGRLQTLDPSSYLVDGASVPGKLRLPYASLWPVTYCQWDAVRIQYVVGWAAADVPKAVKQAMLLLISQMYEHRTPEVLGTVVARLEFAVDRLLGPFRIMRI